MLSYPAQDLKYGKMSIATMNRPNFQKDGRRFVPCPWVIFRDWRRSKMLIVVIFAVQLAGALVGDLLPAFVPTVLHTTQAYNPTYNLLSGFYKYEVIEPQDTGMAVILLLKHNSTTGQNDTVGINTMKLPAKSAYTPFELAYPTPTSQPDSVQVLFSSLYVDTFDPWQQVLFNDHGRLYVDDVDISFTSQVSPSPLPIALEVYPNPAIDKIYLSWDAPLSATPVQAAIYDLQGKKISSHALSYADYRRSIDIGHLSSGIYFLKIVQEGTVLTTEKLVIR